MKLTGKHTSLAAIFLALTTLFSAAHAMVDGDPATNPDWQAVSIQLAAAYGLWKARDDHGGPPLTLDPNGNVTKL